MEQRVSLITLGVDDIGRARRFYEQLGWRGQEVQETVFFQAGGQVVVLWGRAELAADSGVHDDGRGTFDGTALAHNVRSAAEVDEVVREAEAAGATVTRTPAETFYGGYAGCFRDPDGHVWEIAHNPGFGLDDDGNRTVPDLGAAADGAETGSSTSPSSLGYAGVCSSTTSTVRTWMTPSPRTAIRSPTATGGVSNSAATASGAGRSLLPFHSPSWWA